MLLFTSLDEVPPLEKPCGLTLGTFDGVHLGHQALIKHLRSKLPKECLLAVFTFSNHPSQLFTPNAPVPLIYSPLQKVKHLQECGVDLVILTPFTQEFAKIPFDLFLKELKSKLNMTHLVLGTGSTFGKGKEGDEIHVRRVVKELNIEVDYMNKTSYDNLPLSSGYIRTLIQQGHLEKVEACLGRPYSLMGHVIEKEGKGFCPFPGMCLPPQGAYLIHIDKEGSKTEVKALICTQPRGIFLPSFSIGHDVTLTLLKIK
jgi:riboflavin kinase/FMN adenylyltransferase